MGVVLHKFDTEAAWLAMRAQDVTSTEVAALFGLHPHKSRLRLWHEKKGNVDLDFEENDYTEWGRFLQIPVGMKICKDSGWIGLDMTGYYYRDEELRLGCSLDILAKCPDVGDINLEIKIAEEFNPDLGWTETATPLDKEFQVQTQMHLAHKHGTPFAKSIIGTLGKRQKIRKYPRPYDPKVGARIDEELASFWQSIKDDRPPEPDYSVDAELLGMLAPAVREGEGCNLSQNDRAVLLATRWKEIDNYIKPLREQIKPLDKEKKKIQAELLDIMGEKETAIIGPYKISAPDQVREERFVPESEGRRFYFSQPKRR